MSVFLDVPEPNWLAHNALAFAIRDSFPVSNGHTLIITRRQVSTWWEATAEEQRAVLELVELVKQQLDLTHQPDGYNVGFNAGEAAGQTVPHLHVHVIPRYTGDVMDPSGGIRHVIPGKGNYLADARPQLVTPRDRRFQSELRRCLIDPTFDQIDLLIAFVMHSGVRLIAEQIDDALARGASIRLLTTDYLLTTDVGALGFFLDRQGTGPSGGRLEARVFTDPSTSFHPKAWMFRSTSGKSGVAFVGSSNLSWSALARGIEWNLETTGLDELGREFDLLWADTRSRPVTASWLEEYGARKAAVADRRVEHKDTMTADEEPEQPIAPWSVQAEALEALADTRLAGHEAGLVVMATGLGKTWLAAFDSSRPGIRRVLFIAHRS